MKQLRIVQEFLGHEEPESGCAHEWIYSRGFSEKRGYQAHYCKNCLTERHELPEAGCCYLRSVGFNADDVSAVFRGGEEPPATEVAGDAELEAVSKD